MHHNQLAATTREVVELIQLVVHGLVVVTTAPCATACLQIGSICRADDRLWGMMHAGVNSFKPHRVEPVRGL